MTPLVEIKWNDPALIEALARRLYSVTPGNKYATYDASPSSQPTMLAIALECARQMSFTRSQDQEDITFALKGKDQALHLMRPLEPAPLEWTP